MPVSTVRARDVVRGAERFTNSHGHRFFAHIQVSKTGHQGPRVKLIYLFFKKSNHDHSTVHADELVNLHDRSCLGLVCGDRHSLTPDIWARTSKTTAKSFSTRPIPRAAVRNSLLTAVVGMGTSS